MALSSPALTRRIQSLEQFVGGALFDRQHNAVALNEQGERFLGEIAPHLDAIAHALNRVAEHGKTMRIRIAVPSLFASQRLVPALSSLRRHHPDLTVDVDTGASRLLGLTDLFDAAIAITDVVDDKYYARVLEKGRIIAVGARSFLEGDEALRSPADLVRVPILLHRQMPRAFDEWKSAVGYPALEPARINHFDAGQLILDAAAGGLGVAFMLESHLQSSQDNRLVKIFGDSAAALTLTGSLANRPRSVDAGSRSFTIGSSTTLASNRRSLPRTSRSACRLQYGASSIYEAFRSPVAHRDRFPPNVSFWVES